MPSEFLKLILKDVDVEATSVVDPYEEFYLKWIQTKEDISATLYEAVLIVDKNCGALAQVVTDHGRKRVVVFYLKWSLFVVDTNQSRVKI